MTNGDFTVTHVAPPDGLQVWDSPDPARPVLTQLQPGVQMQLLERRGAWAHVAFSNGWSGWVDGRRLVAAAPSPPPPPVETARPAAPPAEEPVPRREPVRPAEPEPSPFGRDDRARFEPEEEAFSWERPSPAEARPVQPRPVEPAEERIERVPPAPAGPAGPVGRDDRHRRDEREGDGAGGALADLLPAVRDIKPSPALIGSAAVLLGTLLSWLRIAGSTGNAYDVPLEFLWNHRTAGGGGLKVGLVLLALGIVAAVFSILPGKVQVRRIIGGVVTAIVLLYTIQLQRALSAGPEGTPSLTSAIGFGVILTLGGAIALIVDRNEPTSRSAD